MAKLANFLLPNGPTCIVACSATDARLWFSSSRFGEWKILKEMGDPGAAQPEKAFASDRPGRAFDSFGAGRHAMSQSESARDHQANAFARDVASYLNQAITDNVISHIVVVAAPKFLGRLRAELSDGASRAVVLEAPKNLTNLDANEIKKYFE